MGQTARGLLSKLTPRKRKDPAPVPAAGMVPRLLGVRGRGWDDVAGRVGLVRPVAWGEQVAGSLVVEVDPAVERPVAARVEAVRLIARVLRVPDTAAAVAAAGVRVRITAGGEARAHTETEETAGMTADGRVVGRVGSGGVVELPARNLLGEEHDGGPVQDEGYAEAVHEAGHLVYSYALDDQQRQLVGELFIAKRDGGLGVVWVDGPRRTQEGVGVDNYASRSPSEWWAQETVAYFGHNHGIDPYTGRERLNGPEVTDPGLRELLETVYGPPEGLVDAGLANPLAATRAEASYYQAFGDFTVLVEASAPVAVVSSARGGGAGISEAGGSTVGDRDDLVDAVVGNDADVWNVGGDDTGTPPDPALADKITAVLSGNGMTDPDEERGTSL